MRFVFLCINYGAFALAINFDPHALTTLLSWVVMDVFLVASAQSKKKALALCRSSRFARVGSAEEEYFFALCATLVEGFLPCPNSLCCKGSDRVTNVVETW